MQLVDTHCHIQSIGLNDSDDFTVKKWREGEVDDSTALIKSAEQAGVNKLICVGTDLADSKRAVEFAAAHDKVWASVGVHPHEASDFLSSEDSKKKLEEIIKSKPNKLIAVGECGLDYYYEHSPKKAQRELLGFQLGLAQKYDLPVIIHIRDAFDDFWPIFDQFEGLRGVVHSFSATEEHLEEALSRGLYIGLNGIMTFTKDQAQLEAAKKVPLDKLLLETDAPYLAPKPYRGKVCKPEHVRATAEFLANLRAESLEELAKSTTQNANKLFGI